jgi:cytochrome c oxidase subunit 2
LLLGFIALALLAAACSSRDLPQSTLDPAGQPAQDQASLFVFVFWMAAAVFVVVEGGILFISIKYRRRGRDPDRVPPPQTHGNTRLEIGWTIAPALVLAIVMVPTISLLWDLARAPGPEAVNVSAIGYQWWWGFEYTDENMQVSYGDGGPIRTTDVLVIPTRRPVYVSVESGGGLIGGENPDFQVIHSFWVPRLAGKQDAVPQRTNHITLFADEPGTYLGQCAEFCGLQHGQMRFRVIVLSQQDWEAWAEAQKLPASEPADAAASRGLDIFLNGPASGANSCTACHAVGGVQGAGGIAGPDLTHFAAPTHECFAGCIWNTDDREALAAWLRDPNAVKLGSKMPNYHLTDEEVNDLIDYLYSLT